MTQTYPEWDKLNNETPLQVELLDVSANVYVLFQEIDPSHVVFPLLFDVLDALEDQIRATAEATAQQITRLDQINNTLNGHLIGKPEVVTYTWYEAAAPAFIELLRGMQDALQDSDDEETQQFEPLDL